MEHFDIPNSYLQPVELQEMERLGFVVCAYQDLSGDLLDEPPDSVFLCTFYDGVEHYTFLTLA